MRSYVYIWLPLFFVSRALPAQANPGEASTASVGARSDCSPARMQLSALEVRAGLTKESSKPISWRLKRLEELLFGGTLPGPVDHRLRKLKQHLELNSTPAVNRTGATATTSTPVSALKFRPSSASKGGSAIATIPFVRGSSLHASAARGAPDSEQRSQSASQTSYLSFAPSAHSGTAVSQTSRNGVFGPSAPRDSRTSPTLPPAATTASPASHAGSSTPSQYKVMEASQSGQPGASVQGGSGERSWTTVSKGGDGASVQGCAKAVVLSRSGNSPGSDSSGPQNQTVHFLKEGSSITVNSNRTVKTFDCTKATASIVASSCEITLRGSYSSVVIQGDNNTVAVSSPASLRVVGNKNRVTFKNSNCVPNICGEENSVKRLADAL